MTFYNYWVLEQGEFCTSLFMPKFSSLSTVSSNKKTYSWNFQLGLVVYDYTGSLMYDFNNPFDKERILYAIDELFYKRK